MTTGYNKLVRESSLQSQEIFNKVYAGLADQGWKRSVLVDEKYGIVNCKYRGPNGMKCAAGILIPDEDYKHRFEGHTISSHHFDPLMSKLGYNHYDVEFIKALQRVHDNATDETLMAEFDKFAESVNLIIPVI